MRKWFVVVGAALLCLAGVVMLVIPAFVRAGEANRRQACQETLKQWGRILNEYAKEHDGRFPSLNGSSGKMLFSLDEIRAYLPPDSSFFVCPDDDEAMARINALPKERQTVEAFYGNSTYCYLGYAFRNERQGMALVDAMKEVARVGGPLPDELCVAAGSGWHGTSSLPALCEDNARGMLVTDINGPSGTARAQSAVPVILELACPHHGGIHPGMNALYGDGHVEYVSCGGEHSRFPGTPTFLAALRELQALRQSLHPQGAPSGESRP